MSPSVVLFLALCVGHALCDFPLQGDFLARAKNHRAPVAAANGSAFPWWIALTAHAAIQAGAVALLMHSPTFGLLEFGAHWMIDYGTSEGRTGGYAGDQFAHVACKALWVVLSTSGAVTP
jgi:hypothetical protein